MTNTFERFSARLGEFIRRSASVPLKPDDRATSGIDDQFNHLALDLFALQFRSVGVYRRFCEARHLAPATVAHWTRIPAMPTQAFKEFELTSLLPENRARVFYSSGTTGQTPGRHFHDDESLMIYEASLLPWFRKHLLAQATENFRFISLTPSPALAPHSSLAHMLETVHHEFGAPESRFVGTVDSRGAWLLDQTEATNALNQARSGGQKVLLLGTAFSFVHLFDGLMERELRFELPPGSRVMETGGYKGRSRYVPRTELHSLITKCLGVPPDQIVCEYGMSELSSQAYDHTAGETPRAAGRVFRFPPWARAHVISPETGDEVGEGETGLVRVFDLANVRSVMTIQTEDLGTRRGEGFDLIGRALPAEPRGCSLMAF